MMLQKWIKIVHCYILGYLDTPPPAAPLESMFGNLRDKAPKYLTNMFNGWDIWLESIWFPNWSFIFTEHLLNINVEVIFEDLLQHPTDSI